MGNSISYSNNNNTEMSGGNGESEKKLENALDYIATYYILTMDFQGLRKLYDKKYCNELVVLTSDIINRNFSDIEIDRLAHRIKHGSSAEKILFIKKRELEHLSSKLEPAEKKMACNYIAKFYIKIAHIFAAILLTINPEYVFTDSTGKKTKKQLSEKSSIPSGAAIEKVNANFCESRINALKGDGEIDLEGANSDNEEIKVKPEICKMDIYTSRLHKSMNDVPGIPELVDLYYDTDYDYKTGNFKGMTKKTEEKFNADLLRFYKTFTGMETMPKNIRTFSDIQLKDYGKDKACSGKSPLFDTEATGTYRDKLFADYANNLKKMLLSVNEKQEKLLKIINQLFDYVKDPTNPEKEVIKVSPELTEEGLQELISETRTAIVELYIECETDFLEGVKLYEAIIESQILETSQNQIETLQSEVVKLTNPYTGKKSKSTHKEIK